MRKWFARAASATSGVASERTAGWGGDDGELEHLENGLGYNHADVEEWVRSQVRQRRAGLPADAARPRMGGTPGPGAGRGSGSCALSGPTCVLVRGWTLRPLPPARADACEMCVDSRRDTETY